MNASVAVCVADPLCRHTLETALCTPNYISGVLTGVIGVVLLSAAMLFIVRCTATPARPQRYVTPPPKYLATESSPILADTAVPSAHAQNTTADLVVPTESGPSASA